MAFRDNCSGSVRKEIVKYENWALNLAQLQQQHLTGSHAPLLPPTHKWHQRAIDANTAMPMVPGGIARVVAEPALGHRSQHLPLGLTLLQMLGSKPHSKHSPFYRRAPPPHMKANNPRATAQLFQLDERHQTWDKYFVRPHRESCKAISYPVTVLWWNSSFSSLMLQSSTFCRHYIPSKLILRKKIHSTQCYFYCPVVLY